MPFKIEFKREELKIEYAKAKLNNDLLARVEATFENLGWTAEEIRTAQLLLVVESNASIQAHAKELQARIDQMVKASTVH